MKDKVLMYYISTWNWFILSTIFLISSLIVVTIDEGISSTIFFMVFLFSFAFCSKMAFNRKKNLDAELDKGVEDAE